MYPSYCYIILTFKFNRSNREKLYNSHILDRIITINIKMNGEMPGMKH
jgi:hypothetical protein